MSIFSFLNKKPTIKGEIGYFNLSEWWLSEFSDEERDHIIKIYQPMGSSGDSLVKGEITSTTQSAIGLLSVLAGWFDNEKDRKFAYRLLKKAEELINDTSNIVDIHFLFMNKLKIYYKDRNKDSDALNKSVEACKQQIEIAPKVKMAFQKEYGNDPLPGHSGFEQLAIIEEKQKKFDSVIEISKKALEQGWAGDWEKRIERCNKKLNH